MCYAKYKKERILVLQKSNSVKPFIYVCMYSCTNRSGAHLISASFKTVWKIQIALFKEWCKQCRYVKFKPTMTKWCVQKPTQRTTQKYLQFTLLPWPIRTHEIFK